MYVGIKALVKRRVTSTTVLCAGATGPSVAGPTVSFHFGNSSGFQKFGEGIRTLTGQELCVSTGGAARNCFPETEEQTKHHKKWIYFFASFDAWLIASASISSSSGFVGVSLLVGGFFGVGGFGFVVPLTSASSLAACS